MPPFRLMTSAAQFPLVRLTLAKRCGHKNYRQSSIDHRPQSTILRPNGPHARYREHRHPHPGHAPKRMPLGERQPLIFLSHWVKAKAARPMAVDAVLVMIDWR